VINFFTDTLKIGIFMSRSRLIYLEGVFSLHTQYTDFIQYPPDGYRVVADISTQSKFFRRIGKARISHNIQRLGAKFIPEHIVKSSIMLLKHPPANTWLTYATGHLVFRNEPWVIDLEFVHAPLSSWPWHFRRYKRLLETSFSSKLCKGIIAWTEAGLRTVSNNLDCTKFKEKLVVIPFAMRPKFFTKDTQAKHQILLFVGSSNIQGEFELKGGRELLEAFISLKSHHPAVELVIRSDVPKAIRKQYQGIPGLKIIDDVISRESLEREYQRADIFVFPSHNTPAMTILEAMSYELPVVTTDVFANPELVQDGKTGFLIKKNQTAHYFKNGIPNWGTSQFMKEVREANQILVQELVEKLEYLLNNDQLRRRFGKAGREEIERGKFSIHNRNNKLKQLFDNIVSYTK
jgi:glycosyltransferase involved in cell wall biosynthesis